MKDIDDFVFKNIQCSAICLAKVGVPIQEQFAFCFNTVLSDLAAHLPEYRDVIVNAQVCSWYLCLDSFPVQQLLNKDILTQLDNHATDVYTGSFIKRFPYKTVSETITLACLSLLRDVLRPFSVQSKDSPVKENFAKELNAFVVDILNSLEVQRMSFLGERRMTPAVLPRRPIDQELPRHSMCILAMTCGLELVVWAAIDDIGLLCVNCVFSIMFFSEL
ncbi:hypothetical protein ANCDUO_10602 [Ancylostoma duodenale]|uniref:Uncharacterized protein n=1 Tax=Ancylostoma duodenale TaxID=51022 RepID=A0A0C2GDE8_9BILA|nr:hypothetical protein ANCDUO_10602 [Ancylostoma duodenale]